MKKIYFTILITLFAAIGAYGEEMKIKMNINGDSVIVSLFDTTASRDLFSRLPMTLKFEDYVGVEKIAYLPQRLTTKGVAEGGKGDFTYYAPWGNLAIFYKGGGGNGVVHLGKIISGKEILAAMDSDFTATIERME